MRQYYWLFAILFRIILPCVMVTTVLIRPTVSSYVYLIMACYMPFFSLPTSKCANESFEFLLKVLVIMSMLTTTLVLSFYFALYFNYKEFYEIEYCDTIEIALRTIGIVPYNNLPIKDALNWILPEPVILAISVLLLKGFDKFQTTSCHLDIRHDLNKSNKPIELIKVATALRLGKYFTCLMLCLSAVLKPSIFGGIYYLTFLGTLTYWACNHRLNRTFARIICCLVPVEFMQLTSLFLYQLQYVQDNPNFDRSSLWIRLLALVPLTTYKDCSDPRLFTSHYQTKISYATFFSVFVLYTVSVLSVRLILRAEDGLIGFVKACFRQEQTIHLRWMMVLDKLRDDLGTTKSTLKDQELPVEKAVTMLDDILRFIFSISTLLANLMMMVWAIAYVGTKSILLLVIANLVWLMPARKRVMLLISPLIAVYISFMLLAAYIYSLEVTPSELPSKFGEIDLRSGIGELNQQKWVELFIKSLIGVIIGVAVRQLLQEKSMQRQEAELLKSGARMSTQSQAKSKKVRSIERFRLMLLQFLSIWWIWVVIIAMIWMEFWSFSSHFRIGFVGLAFVFLLTFQFCPFKYWKKFLNVFWWIAVIYSMFHLFIVYAFQLDDLRNIMLKAFTMNQFEEIGCWLWQNSEERFEALVNPLFLQIAVVIQQNYLQKEFNKVTEPDTPEAFAQRLTDRETYSQSRKAVVTIFQQAKDIVFTILEVHLLNIAIFFGWLMCAYDVCAVFAPFVILLTISCIVNRKYSKIIIYLLAGMVQVFVILRLVHMSTQKEHSKWNIVGYYTRKGKSYNVTLNTADWIGFHESQYGTEYADFKQLIWCFVFIFLVTLDRIVTIRMENHRKTRTMEEPVNAVMFPDITYKNSHESVGNMLKFLANYGFYKLGCEITMIYSSILMMMRMDAMAIILGFGLLMTSYMSRVQLQKFWIVFLLFYAIIIPLQYLTTLGLWPSMFYESSTQFWNLNDLRVRIQQFCHLPNMAHPPIKQKISHDFMLILVASRQWLAFKRERKGEEQDVLAGSNENVSHLIDDPNSVNPIPDFTIHLRRNLDLFNYAFFTSWFYASLVAVFLAGTMRPSIYSLGFIFGASGFLWVGSDLFLMAPEKIMKRWNFLIAFNILVMLAKTVTQIIGCVLVYNRDLTFNCRAITYFSIGCVDYYGMTDNIPDVSKTTLCSANTEELGLEWDCLCFFFLLCQQRIFKSFYFFHIVNDVKAHVVLADRGVEVIAEMKKTKKEAFDLERATIENNIKNKLDRIKANSSKIAEIRRGNYSHFVEVVRDIDIPLLPPQEEIDEEYQSYDPMPLTEYFGLFFSTDIDTVLEITDIRSRRKKAFILKALGKKKLKEKTSDSDKTSTKTSIKVIRFIWGAFESSIVSITGIIDRTSITFRLILNEIATDITILKEKTNYTIGKRLGPNQIWSPMEDYKTILNKERKKIRRQREMQYSIYIKLLKAIWFAINAYSEWLCYLMIMLYQALLNDLISLPLILMTFCWGSLSVPRPTKMFWIVNFAYCLVMVLIKHICDLGIAPWGEDETKFSSIFAPRFLGFYNRMKFLTMVLMMVLFFHRLVLRQLGLWKTTFYWRTSTLADGDYYLKDGKFQPAKPQDKSQTVLGATTKPITLGDYFPASLYRGLAKYGETIRMYVQGLISPSSTQVPVDVYTPMFFCDLVNLVLLIFFFGHFTSDPENKGVLDFVSQNRVPVFFLAFVITYMLFMMIDRALYVRKNRFSKLVFHVAQVLGYHMWFFIVNPITNRIVLADSVILQIFYVCKCVYFVFSAYQIRSGYPTIISFHYLWHGYSLLNRFGYKFFRSIPYFLEIRCLLDWICTDTCLELDAWFKMEDVTQSLFDQKCQQEFETKWSSPGGQRRSRTSKLLLGSFLYSILVLTLIFPFLLFSSGTAIGVTSRPEQIKMELFMGRTMPIYQATSTFRTIGLLTEDDYENITSTFNNIDNSQLFDEFTNEDTLVFKWPRDSLRMWTVSPGSKLDLLKELHEDDYFVIRLELTYKHTAGKDSRFVKMFGQNTFLFRLPDENRQHLINMIKGQASNNSKPVTLSLIFPKFLKIRRDGSPKVLSIMEFQETEQELVAANDQDYDDDDDDTDSNPEATRFRDILLTLKTTDGKKFWWQLREKCELNDDNYLNYLANLVHNDCNNLIMYVFNEKVFSGSLNYLTKGGILGLYLIYFMVILGLIRSCRADVNEIWIHDLPNADILLRKCMEIYVARDMKNFELENEIYEEMVAIMRSREVVIKLTRYEDNQYDPTYWGI